MQYRGLRAFCVAARHLSFKLAADELSVTPSAISHQIRDLESYLGCKLFVRDTRSIELTMEGQRLFGDLREPIAEVSAALARIRAYPDRVPIHFEMPAFFSSELFLPKMANFSAVNQTIDLRIETTAPNDAESRQADIHVLLCSHKPQSQHAEKLFSIRYQPACSPSQYKVWSEKKPEDLQNATLLVHEARPNAWQQWFNDANVALQTPQQTITVDSMYGLARAVQQGVGIGLIPLPVSQQWFASGELIPLFDHQLVSSDFYWLTSNEVLKEQVPLKILWDWVIAEFSDAR